MTITIRLVSCMVALFAATTLFVHGLFVQTRLEASDIPAIALFGLSVFFFGLSTFHAIRLRDALADRAHAKADGNQGL